MDDQCLDGGRSIEITTEHAVLIPALPSVKNVMAYVEAVAVVIGSCHIHSVYEDEDNVKVYLNDKRFVDILVNNGVSILGRQMNVDYAAPRSDKVVLSNIDPIVPDAAIMKLLSMYGQPVSAVIHEKIATNCEYSHIECGKRRVYMKIFADKNIPSNISFTFGENRYQMDVVVERWDRNTSCEPPAVRNEEEINDEQLEVGSNQSLKPNIQELMAMNSKQPTPNQLAYRNRGGKSSPPAFTASAARRIKRRARGTGWYSNRMTRVKRSKMNGVNNPVGRAKRLVVEKAASSVSGIKKGRGGYQRKLGRPSSNRSISNQEINPEPFDVVELSSDETAMEQGPVETIDTQSISSYPLSFEELQKFVFKTRFHREPMQVAMEFLAENKSPEVMTALQNQLQEYHNACKDQALKFRIKRLVSVVKSANEIAE